MLALTTKPVAYLTVALTYVLVAEIAGARVPGRGVL